MRSNLTAIAFVFGSLVAAPAHAEAPNQQAVVAACTSAAASGDGCQIAVRQYFTTLQAAGVAGVRLQQAVADLVVALAGSSTTASASVQAVVADALETIAGDYAAPGQVADIRSVARQIDAGTPPADPVIRVSASPA